MSTIDNISGFDFMENLEIDSNPISPNTSSRTKRTAEYLRNSNENVNSSQPLNNKRVKKRRNEHVKRFKKEFILKKLLNFKNQTFFNENDFNIFISIFKNHYTEDVRSSVENICTELKNRNISLNNEKNIPINMLIHELIYKSIKNKTPTFSTSIIEIPNANPINDEDIQKLCNDANHTELENTNSSSTSTDSTSSTLLELCKTKNYEIIAKTPEFKLRCNEKDFKKKWLNKKRNRQTSFSHKDFTTFLELEENNLYTQLMELKIYNLRTGTYFTKRQIIDFVKNARNDYAVIVFAHEVLEEAGIIQDNFNELVEICMNDKLAELIHREEYLERSQESDFRMKCLEQYINNPHLLSNNPYIIKGNKNEHYKQMINNFVKFKECFLKSNSLQSICKEFNEMTNVHLDPKLCGALIDKSIYAYGVRMFANEILEQKNQKEKEIEKDKQNEKILFEFLNNDNTNEFPFRREEELNL